MAADWHHGCSTARPASGSVELAFARQVLFGLHGIAALAPRFHVWALGCAARGLRLGPRIELTIAPRQKHAALWRTACKPKIKVTTIFRKTGAVKSWRCPWRHRQGTMALWPKMLAYGRIEIVPCASSSRPCLGRRSTYWSGVVSLRADSVHSSPSSSGRGKRISGWPLSSPSPPLSTWSRPTL